MKRTLTLRQLLLICMVTVLCAPVFSQPQQRNLRSVLFVHVKLDQQDAWKSGVKDLAAIYKKAGVEQPWTVWRSQTGNDEFAVVWYSEKWKEIGEQDPKIKPSQAQIDAIFKKLDNYTTGTEMWIDEIQPDMLISSGQMPKMVRTGRVRIASGKMDDARALFHDQLYPAYKKSGVSDFGVAVARYGTPTNEIHTYAAVTSWADFDSPFGAQKGMSSDDWKTFQEKLTPIIDGGVEFTVWEFQPELSYLPAPAK